MMRGSIGWLAAVALLVTAVVFVAHLRQRTAGIASATRATSVSGGGFTLASTSVELPADDAATFPVGLGADLLDANCTGCHSAGMVLGQPPLKPEQWKATVTKMREVYKAPIAERDVPALLGHLSALSARRAGDGKLR